MLVFHNKYFNGASKKMKNPVFDTPKFIATYKVSKGKVHTIEMPFGANIVFLIELDAIQFSRVDEHLFLSAEGYNSLLFLRFFRSGGDGLHADFIEVGGKQTSALAVLTSRGVDCKASPSHNWHGTPGFTLIKP